MASGNVPMYHDDIWDDSALVRSWDDALAEYKASSSATTEKAFRNVQD